MFFRSWDDRFEEPKRKEPDVTIIIKEDSVAADLQRKLPGWWFGEALSEEAEGEERLPRDPYTHAPEEGLPGDALVQLRAEGALRQQRVH